LKTNVEELYRVFRSYQINSDLKDVGVFDFGPSESELEGISKSLRDIPDSVLLSMEFYGWGWDSWGTEEEVKYFLPRLLELISEDISKLETLFSLIKYKLPNIFLPHSDWPVDEVGALHRYFSKLLLHNASGEIGYLLEALIVMGMPSNEIIDILNVSAMEVQHESADNVLQHFGIGYESDSPYALHVSNESKSLRQICNWAFKVLTTE